MRGRQAAQIRRWVARAVAAGLLVSATAAISQDGGNRLAPPEVPALDVRQMFGVATPMRDGVSLVSDIYLPGSPGRHPVVLFRSPYQRNEDINDKESMVKLARRFAAQGIGFVHQDTRGRGDSDGRHEFFFTEGADGYDTIEWIAKQPWSNGQVAMLGGSYRGSVQWLAAREHPPHLTCLFSQSPGATWFNAVPFTGGAFQMEWSLTYLNLTSGRLNNGVAASKSEWDKIYRYRPLIDQDRLMGRELPDRRAMLQHPTLDAYWRRIMLTPADYASIRVPAIHVTGWYDGQLPDSFSVWNGMQTNSPARASQYLLVGPWVHAETRSGGSATLGDRDRGAQSVVDIDALSLRWFKACFAGTTAQFDAPRARVFLTGVNQWRDVPAYPDPAAQVQSWYLHSAGDAVATSGGGGTLSTARPGGETPDTYIFDPRDLAPRGKPMSFKQKEPPRADQLVYQTAALAAPLAVLGPIKLTLIAATSARDTDFAAVLYDVDPQGRALPVTTKTAILRARYREGFDRQVMMEPGKPATLELKFFDVGHVFLPGHRVRIDVSSYAPGINPNQNTGADIATDTEWRSARQTVFHDAARASRLELPVIPWR